LTIDSCKLRKLDPGLEAIYSMPVALITSTIKSEPGLAMIFSDGLPEPEVSELELPDCVAAALATTCVPDARLLPMTVAAVAAAPFKKERRSMLWFPMISPSSGVGRQFRRTLARQCPVEVVDGSNVG